MVPLALAALACPFLRKRMRVRGHAACGHIGDVPAVGFADRGS